MPLIAVNAVLEQKSGDTWKPLGFFSKILSGTESRYSIYDWKLLAAYLGTRHFLHHIEGRLITLRTDHKPLVYMFTHRTGKNIDRQIRHISFLSQYVHTVELVLGVKNVVPDALLMLEVSASQVSLDFKE